MNKIIVFLIALVGAGAMFYALDHLLMGAQGLPIGWDLMPATK